MVHKHYYECKIQGDFKMECKYSIIIKSDPMRVNEALWGRGQIWDVVIISL